MNRKTLLALTLFTAVFIAPVLPPLASAATPQTIHTQAVLNYYNTARTILYASLAISVINVAFAYHFYNRTPQGKKN